MICITRRRGGWQRNSQRFLALSLSRSRPGGPIPPFELADPTPAPSGRSPCAKPQGDTRGPPKHQRPVKKDGDRAVYRAPSSQRWRAALPRRDPHFQTWPLPGLWRLPIALARFPRPERGGDEETAWSPARSPPETSGTLRLRNSWSRGPASTPGPRSSAKPRGRPGCGVRREGLRGCPMRYLPRKALLVRAGWGALPRPRAPSSSGSHRGKKKKAAAPGDLSQRCGKSASRRHCPAFRDQTARPTVHCRGRAKRPLPSRPSSPGPRRPRQLGPPSRTQPP